jgi:hypothetical protein
MNTAKLPARLHEFYPLDTVPLDELPCEGEVDFNSLSNISNRIIHKLEQVNFGFLECLPSLSMS